ncbi:MAG: hypothetical protein KYX68_07960 [Flavobacterium sp.]|nr:hypothetical protein [Flavobacterium sp.]MDK2772140.1 hypothetical protein [Flavobacterium sp.]
MMALKHKEIMILEIIEKWEENKFKLEEYFKTTKQSEYSNYKDIVVKLFEIVIVGVKNKWNGTDNYDVSKITVIDDGDYQGTQIFLIPKETYQPSVEDYIMTNTYYGSCSGCDTLQGFSCYDDDLPTEEQISEYMTLALHLVQKMKFLTDSE